MSLQGSCFKRRAERRRESWGAVGQAALPRGRRRCPLLAAELAVGGGFWGGEFSSTHVPTSEVWKKELTIAQDREKLHKSLGGITERCFSAVASFLGLGCITYLETPFPRAILQFTQRFSLQRTPQRPPNFTTAKPASWLASGPKMENIYPLQKKGRQPWRTEGLCGSHQIQRMGTDSEQILLAADRLSDRGASNPSSREHCSAQLPCRRGRRDAQVVSFNPTPQVWLQSLCTGNTPRTAAFSS